MWTVSICPSGPREDHGDCTRNADWKYDSGDFSERSMRIAPHSRTVTPVISLPQDSVIVPELCSLVALAMASSTGGFAAAPCPARDPAATTISKPEKYGCVSSMSRIA